MPSPSSKCTPIVLNLNLPPAASFSDENAYPHTFLQDISITEGCPGAHFKAFYACTQRYPCGNLHVHANACTVFEDMACPHNDADTHSDDACSANVLHDEHLHLNSRDDANFVHAHVDGPHPGLDGAGAYSSGNSCEPALSPYSSASSRVVIAESHGLASADENGESSEIYWTYNKHRTCLDLMEASFVENLDVCSQALWRLKSSGSACSQFKLSEFKSRQNGDWRWRVISKPYKSPCLSRGLLRNPWVNHFRHPIKPTHRHSSLTITKCKEVDAKKMASAKCPAAK